MPEEQQDRIQDVLAQSVAAGVTAVAQDELDSRQQTIDRLTYDLNAMTTRYNLLRNEHDLAKTQLASRVGAGDQIVALQDELEHRQQVNEDLRAQVNRLDQGLKDLRTEYSDVERRLQEKAKELEAFRERVVRVAMEVAQEHDFCWDGVNDALKRLGLKPLAHKYSATLNITVEFTATMNSVGTEPDEGWVWSSIDKSRLQDAITEGFQMDNDHSDSSVDNTTFQVTTVGLIDD
jgi:small-conductance mechanosensitive channel